MRRVVSRLGCASSLVATAVAACSGGGSSSPGVGGDGAGSPGDGGSSPETRRRSSGRTARRFHSPVAPLDAGPIAIGDGAKPRHPHVRLRSGRSIRRSRRRSWGRERHDADLAPKRVFARSAVAAGGIITFDCGGYNPRRPIPITVREAELSTKGDTAVIDGGGPSSHSTAAARPGRSSTSTVETTASPRRPSTPPEPRRSRTFEGLIGDARSIAVRARALLAGLRHRRRRRRDLDQRRRHLHVIGCIARSSRTRRLLQRPDVDEADRAGVASTDDARVAPGVTSRFAQPFRGNTASNGGAVGCLNSDLAIAWNATFSSEPGHGLAARTASTPRSAAPTAARSATRRERWRDLDRRRLRRRPPSFAARRILARTSRGRSAARSSGRPTARCRPRRSTSLRTFDLGNQSGRARGGAFYFHNSDLVITSPEHGGSPQHGTRWAGVAVQADGTTLALTNDTFAGDRLAPPRGSAGPSRSSATAGRSRAAPSRTTLATAAPGYFAAAIKSQAAVVGEFTINDTPVLPRTTRPGTPTSPISAGSARRTAGAITAAPATSSGPAIA